MGRFGLLSLGHGAFFGVGAYISSLLFNYYNLSPYLGMLVGGLTAMGLAVAIGYPCFRFGVAGAYFTLVTIALSEALRLTYVAMRDITGGLLGLTIRYLGHSPLYLQFVEKQYYCYIAIAFWLLSLYIWRRLERSRLVYALRALSEDELAAEHSGINVLKAKLQITILSSFLTALGGTLYAQTILYISPDISGVVLSLEIAFMAILGGLYSNLGPLLGCLVFISVSEYLRVQLGGAFLGLSYAIFGPILILLIIFLPSGIHGGIRSLVKMVRKSK